MTGAHADATIPFELDPEPSQWPALLDATPPTPDALAARRSLGLPADRPIVLSGHQAEFWHAGIAAKLMAARAVAERTGSAVAWLVVDTDTNDPFEVPVPIADDAGRVSRRTLTLAGRAGDADIPTGLRPPAMPSVDKGMLRALPAAVRPRLEHAIELLVRYRDAASAAEQVTRATLEAIGGAMPVVITATGIAKTEAFASLVSAVERDAGAGVAAYNAAVRASPDSGIAPLDEAGLPELPFWTLRGTVRRPARASDPAGAVRWPRALTLTGFARARLCDLFVQGTGGRAYEPINDRWLPKRFYAALAPAVTATASLPLLLDDDDADSPATPAQAAWRAHHARHHPSLLDEPAAQAERDALVAEIATLPRSDPRRAERFAALHALLDGYRSRRRDRLKRLDDAAADARVRLDRTFPAAWHTPARLAALERQIIGALA